MERREPYWEEEDVEALAHARTFEDLRAIAVRVLKRMPRPIGQVCGPISTGNDTTIKENLERIQDAIEKLIAKEVTIFNQIPFEMSMQRNSSIACNHLVYSITIWLTLIILIFPAFVCKQSSWYKTAGAYVKLLAT